MAVSTAGEPIALHKVELPRGTHPRPGHSEQDPEVWWRGLCGALHGLLHELRGHRPAALALDGTSGTLLLLDAAGGPLAPGLMYDDARGGVAVPRIAEVAPAEAAVHGATTSLAKLLVLLEEHRPSKFARVLHQAEWLAGRLIGRFDQGDENNCLKLGYDPVARGWPDWLGDLGVSPRWLPQVRPVGTALGQVSVAAARQTGLTAGLPVYAGTTDSVAAALAAGLVHTGDATTALGSTLALKILADRPVNSGRHGVYSHRVFDRWLAGGASNSGGAVLRAYFSTEELAEMTPDLRFDVPTELDYYPLLRRGERFPVNDPELAPQVNPRPADPVRFFQGLLEGIARIERDGYALLQTLGAPAPRRVLSTGGGAANLPWQGFRQELLGVPVTAARHGEAAIGAALIARHGAGAAS